MGTGRADGSRGRPTSPRRAAPATPSRAATAAPRTRAERRQAARTRRNRLMLAGAAGLSTLIVVAWFPASDLLHQRQQLASATTELDHVRQQDAALAKQAARLKTPTEIARIAQQQDELVAPGEQAYQVLPPSSAPSTGSSTTGAPSTTTTTAPATEADAQHGTVAGASAPANGSSPSFIGRVLQTLEFWR